MKATILFLAIMTSAGIFLYGQGSANIVYGNVGYENQSGVEVIYTFGYPVIDVLRSDDVATVTAGIPPVIITGGTVSTKTILPLVGISVFPNPVDETLHVKREELGQDYVLQLFNLHGVELRRMHWTAGDNNLQIRMNDISSGQYFLRLVQENNGATAQFKLVKVE